MQPANFFRVANDSKQVAETVAQVFMGSRIMCAQCHNHPYESWTQDNYYGLGAFFNRVQRKGTQRQGETFIYFNTQGEVTQPRTGSIMRPWLPSRGAISETIEGDRRQAFVDWLIEDDNPFFARMEVVECARFMWTG